MCDADEKEGEPRVHFLALVEVLSFPGESDCLVAALIEFQITI